MSVTKECRPKSALRRKAAVQPDRQQSQPPDLDLTEGEMEQFSEGEYSTNMVQQSKTEGNQSDLI